MYTLDRVESEFSSDCNFFLLARAPVFGIGFRFGFLTSEKPVRVPYQIKNT